MLDVGLALTSLAASVWVMLDDIALSIDPSFALYELCGFLPIDRSLLQEAGELRRLIELGELYILLRFYTLINLGLSLLGVYAGIWKLGSKC